MTRTLNKRLLNAGSTSADDGADTVESVVSVKSTGSERSQAAQRMRAGQWHANLELTVEQRPAGARLVNSRRNGPLHVQKAFYPEGRNLAHLYVLHPPGGLVSGDSLTIQARVSENSAALITTPGAGRLYGARADASQQMQNNQLSVEPGASLEWFPMETLFYSGSYGISHTRIDIAEGGSFMGWDIATLGLPASDQPFIKGELKQSLEIHYMNQISWLERWRFNADDHEFLNSPAGLNGNSTNGVFIAGPFDSPVSSEVLDDLHQLCESVRENDHGYAGVTQVDKWLAVRYTGPSATRAREHFTQAWHQLRPLLINRTACPPRIWAC